MCMLASARDAAYKLILHAIVRPSQFQRRNELPGAISRGAFVHSYILGAIEASARADSMEVVWKYLE
jgi:hypothetical protein